MVVVQRLTNMGPVPKSLAERFWAKVDQSGGPDACWPWQGAKDGMGYGQLTVGSVVDGSRLHMRASRAAFELAYPGLLQDGECVLHRCDNPICCNALHLFAGSHADNMADMRLKGRGTKVKGELVWNAVLTENLVRIIRGAYAKGDVSQRVLAKTLGFKRGVVKNVLEGRTWRHVKQDSGPRPGQQGRLPDSLWTRKETP